VTSEEDTGKSTSSELKIDFSSWALGTKKSAKARRHDFMVGTWNAVVLCKAR